uniref:Uncharacterized protein n=1 Tax=Eutreptiella gymnastica TaxID=73025 RepID=A0A7S1JFL7_9EUGL|mmetsp:Transcript_90188/g.156159  ORF Transcript_90188/g.156159 Transcript_90188/m.156159 type:complete len:142 (+) Transcript_90188:310-735(+)
MAIALVRGFFFALACDWRIMRTGFGWMCLPEVNLGMRLQVGFAELVKAKLPPALLRESVLLATRYTSQAALAKGLIDAECPVEELMARALAMAEERLQETLKLDQFDPKALKQIKTELYTDAHEALSRGQPIGFPSASARL